MTTLEPIVKDSGYENWVKGALSLKVAKKGIETFVDRNTDKFHKDTLNSLATSACCSNCTHDDIVKKNKKCPNNCCDNIKNVIVNEHRFRGPTWRNTDVKRWRKEPWALAKCFISPGYESTTSASDTDFAGLLAVIINHKMFDSQVTVSLATNNNIFCQARDVRNKILHKADEKLTDQELKDYVAKLDSILSDSTCLAGYQDAKDAKRMLDKIINGPFTITTEEIRETEAMRRIAQKEEEALEKINKEKDDAVQFVRNTGKRLIDDVNDEFKEFVCKQRKFAKSDIKTAKNYAITLMKKAANHSDAVLRAKKEDILTCLDKKMKDSEENIQANKEDALTTLDKKEKDSEEVLQAKKEAAITEIEIKARNAEKVLQSKKDEAVAAQKTISQDSYEQIKKDMLADLISLYQEDELMSAPLFPLLITEHRHIEEMYVKPHMKIDNETVDSYNDIFKDGRTKIYVVGDAGLGKTSLCQKMVSTWCQVHSARTISNMPDNQQTIKHSKTHMSDQKSLSEKQISSDEKNVSDGDIVAVEHELTIEENLSDGEDKTLTEEENNSDWETVSTVSSLFDEENVSDGEDKTLTEEENNSDWETLSTVSSLFDEENVSDGEDKTLTEEEKHSDWETLSTVSSLFDEENVSDGEDKTLTEEEHMSDWETCSTEQSSFDEESVSDCDNWHELTEAAYSLFGYLSNEQKLSNYNDLLANQHAMADFDFLFYVSLRDAINHNDVEDMIKEQLLTYKFHDDLPTILKNEKCLVILDGLDEWTRDYTTGRRQNRGIPGRQAIRNCTVLTTTRPWKLEAIQLTSTQIDAKVELLGIGEVSSETLLQIMLNHLNKKNNMQKKIQDFILEIRTNKLDHFKTIPVILKQLICLWFSGKPLGQNKCAIYSQMIEFQLELGQKGLKDDPKYQEKKDEWLNSSIQLPSCFDDNAICQEFKPLIVALSELSFYTLLNLNEESSLVFKQSQAEIHGMTADDINISLKIGILSQSGIIRNCRSEKKISFIHKSYQEFFAALFVSMDQTEYDQRVQTIQQICNSREKCLEMQNMITFISGMCSSDVTCTLMSHLRHYVDDMRECNIDWQVYLTDCLSEGWCCSHNNKHMQCYEVHIKNNLFKQEHLELLCQANINNIKQIFIYTTPTARCLALLLKVNTLVNLYTYLDSVSEDNLYSIIQKNSKTLTFIYILEITLRSRTKLSTLLHTLQNLSGLCMYVIDVSKHQLDSLRDLSEQRPDIYMDILTANILPDIECTD